MFFNHLTQKNESEAVEFKNGGWYIKVGFSGFNSTANNRGGYKSASDAEGAILRYQNKIKRM